MPDRMTAEIERLQAENAALRVALGFYADPDNWDTVNALARPGEAAWTCRYAVSNDDTEWDGKRRIGGKRARAALAPKENGDA